MTSVALALADSGEGSWGPSDDLPRSPTAHSVHSASPFGEVDVLITALDEQGLEAIARWAGELQARATDRLRRFRGERAMHAETRRRAFSLQQIPTTVLGLETDGFKPEAARDRAAQLHRCPRVTIDHYMRRHERRREAQRRVERNREIMRLAHKGLTNEEVARHPRVVAINGGTMHPASISRIVQKQLGNRKGGGGP